MLFDETKPVGGTFTDVERARKWDARISKLENDNKGKVQKIAEMLCLTSESVIADLGCGTGFFTVELSRYCKYIYAVDISPIMLELLESKIATRNISNIRCVNKGILRYLTDRFHVDAFIMQTSFHHLPDFWKAVAIDHMSSALNTGGKVFLSDVIFSFPVSDYEVHFSDLLQHIGSKRDDGLTKDAEKHLLEEYSTFDWIIEEMFAKSNFKIVSKIINSSTHCNYVFEKK